MNFIQIRTYDNYVRANIELSMLQDAGISCHLRDEMTLTIDPLLNPMIGGIKLMVYETHATRASEMLDTLDRDYLQTIACPNCASGPIIQEQTIQKPENFIDYIRYCLYYGQPRKVTNNYVCQNCHSVFDELPDISW